jgi:hypothetical protein
MGVLTAALSALRNVVMAGETVQAVIDAGALPALSRLITHPRAPIRQYAHTALAYILSSSQAHIQLIIDVRSFFHFFQLFFFFLSLN